jgi:hypothetical protein
MIEPKTGASARTKINKGKTGQIGTRARPTSSDPKSKIGPIRIHLQIRRIFTCSESPFEIVVVTRKIAIPTVQM